MKRIKVYYHTDRASQWFNTRENNKPGICDFLTDYVCIVDTLFSDNTSKNDIYCLLNDDRTVDQFIKQSDVEKLKTHTSMSTGDIMYINGRAWIVMPVGFDELEDITQYLS